MKRLSPMAMVLLGALLGAGIARTGETSAATPAVTPAVATGQTPVLKQPKIQHVFFAQHHVQTPSEPLFKLVGNLEAVIEVKVIGEQGSPSPEARATLWLGGKTLELTLKGPAQLPAPANANAKLVEHGYEESFTATIPKEWIAPGLKVTVQLRGAGTERIGPVLDQRVIAPVKVGAPTRMVMTMYDIHYFGGDEGGDYPKGWFEGLTARLPVAELQMNRVRNIVFNTLVQMPRGDAPAVRCTSREDYKTKAGIAWDGEQALALKWIASLKRAAGAEKTKRPYYLSIYGVFAGGQGGGLSAVGYGKSHGILLHELGHALGGMPDLYGKALEKFPYVGPMKDYPAPNDAPGQPHVGPTWGFDPLTKEFIPSISNGTHRRDPMGGGGANKDDGPGGMYRFYSDYHLARDRDRLEESQTQWDAKTRQYRAWDQATGKYSRIIGRAGADGFPIEQDIEVVSLLGSASLVTRDANIIYPPIGPYVAARVGSFDASVAAARAAAKLAGYTDENCHFCLRVTQGDQVKTYLIRDGLDPKLGPTAPASFATFAINLPARDGVVTKMEMLETPGVISRGLNKNAKALDTWTGKYQTTTETLVCPGKPSDAR